MAGMDRSAAIAALQKRIGRSVNAEDLGKVGASYADKTSFDDRDIEGAANMLGHGVDISKWGVPPPTQTPGGPGVEKGVGPPLQAPGTTAPTTPPPGGLKPPTASPAPKLGPPPSVPPPSPTGASMQGLDSLMGGMGGMEMGGGAVQMPAPNSIKQLGRRIHPQETASLAGLRKVY